MVFVADDLGAWLARLLADAGRKKLTTLVLGSDQERALRRAAMAAFQLTAAEPCPDGGERADHLAMVISSVFSGPVSTAPVAGHSTVLEVLRAGIAGQLAALDDANLTGSEQSSAYMLGVSTGSLAPNLTGHLLQQRPNKDRAPAPQARPCLATFRNKLRSQDLPANSIQLILDDLSRDLNNLTAAHAFSAVGLRRIPEYFAVLPKHPGNPDPLISIGTGPPNNPDTPAYAAWRLSEALKQVEQNGPVETGLGHQWIVFLYELWDHEYRPRLAEVHHRHKDDEKYDLLGDLRHLRNDVVHHRGIATSGNTGRCVLLYHWFQPGDVIRLEGRHFDEFIRMFPWSDLDAGTNNGRA